MKNLRCVFWALMLGFIGFGAGSAAFGETLTWSGGDAAWTNSSTTWTNSSGEQVAVPLGGTTNDLILSSGTATVDTGAWSADGVKGTFTINAGGTWRSTTENQYWNISPGTVGAKMTVNGGTFELAKGKILVGRDSGSKDALLEINEGSLVTLRNLGISTASSTTGRTVLNGGTLNVTGTTNVAQFNTGDMVVNGGTFSSGTLYVSSSGSNKAASNGTLTLNAGNTTIRTFYAIQCPELANATGADKVRANLVLNGGTLTVTDFYGGSNYINDATVNTNSETNIIVNGGTLSATNFYGGNSYINGVTANTNPKTNVVVNGGTLSAATFINAYGNATNAKSVTVINDGGTLLATKFYMMSAVSVADSQVFINKGGKLATTTEFNSIQAATGKQKATLVLNGGTLEAKNDGGARQQILLTSSTNQTTNFVVNGGTITGNIFNSGAGKTNMFVLGADTVWDLDSYITFQGNETAPTHDLYFMATSQNFSPITSPGAIALRSNWHVGVASGFAALTSNTMSLVKTTNTGGEMVRNWGKLADKGIWSFNQTFGNNVKEVTVSLNTAYKLGEMDLSKAAENITLDVASEMGYFDFTGAAGGDPRGFWLSLSQNGGEAQTTDLEILTDWMNGETISNGTDTLTSYFDWNAETTDSGISFVMSDLSQAKYFAFDLSDFNDFYFGTEATGFQVTGIYSQDVPEPACGLLLLLGILGLTMRRRVSLASA